MKHIYQLILFSLITINLNNFYLQQNCNNDVSTDHNNPSNNALPSNPNANDYLNNFNWLQRNVNLELQKYQTYGLNQGLLLTGDEIMNIYSNASGSHYKYIYDAIEPSFENGWELMSVNLGYYPSGVPLLDNDYTDLPYMMLYNRYTGVLRVFGLCGPGYSAFGTSIDAVKINLYFEGLTSNGGANGTLRLNAGMDQALDKITKITNVASMAKHPNANGKWFSSDFQLTYDPCVCYFPSKLRVEFEFIETQSIVLQGRAISLENDIVSNTSGLNGDKDFLSSFEYDRNNDVSTIGSGLIMYKAMENLIDDYIVKLEAYKAKLDSVNAHNDKVERNLAILKYVSKALKFGAAAVTSGGSESVTFFLLKLEAPDLVLLGDSISKDKLTRELEKILGKELNEYISGKFKKKDAPSKPSPPSAVFTEMNFQGSVTQSSKVTGPLFYTPGSYGSTGTGSPLLSNSSNYPVYNDPVGVFALLESPEVLVSVNTNDVYSWWYYSDLGEPTEYAYEYYFEDKIQWKISNPLKYTFNPKLDIKSYDIKASIHLNSTLGNFKRVADYNSWCFDYIDTQHQSVSNVNIEYPSFLNSDNNYIISQLDSSVNIEGMFFDLNAFQNITYEFNHKAGFSGNGEPLCFFIGSDDIQTLPNNAKKEFLINDVYLKLLINVEYNSLNSEGGSHEYTYIYTYKISENDITLYSTELVPNLQNSSYDVGQYEENLSLSNLIFDGSPVEGCKLNGTHYTCRAWNDILIEGDLSTANGYTVDIMAGNEIEVVGESEISPEIVLSIEPVLDYSNPMPPATETYVNNFCQGLNPNAPFYNAHLSKNYVENLVNEDEDEETEEELIRRFNFSLFPNPAQSTTNVQYNVNEYSEVNIFITDLTGRKVLEPVLPNTMRDMGVYEIQINTGDLANGVYLCTVKVGNKSKTKQLIIQ